MDFPSITAITLFPQSRLLDFAFFAQPSYIVATVISSKRVLLLKIILSIKDFSKRQGESQQKTAGEFDYLQA